MPHVAMQSLLCNFCRVSFTRKHFLLAMVASHLFIEGDVALLVHLVLGVADTGSFAGTKLDININLKEETKS